MQPDLVALVLFSAFLHAMWGAAVKSSRDRLMAATTGVLVPALICVVLARQVTAPAVEAWPFLAGSAALHVGYYAFLLLAYRVGDLSQVYPIARGGAPLVVAAIVTLWLDEPMPQTRAAGVALVSAGLFALAIDRRLFTRQGAVAVGCASAAALIIGSSTALDFIGLQRANATLGYIVWINLAEAVVLVPAVLWFRRRRLNVLPWRELPRQAMAGVVVAASYAMLLWALSLGAAAPVAALRETSVVFAALIGTAFLGEPLGRRRIAAALVVALGVVVLNLNL